jgi:hypothetical protein
MSSQKMVQQRAPDAVVNLMVTGEKSFRQNTPCSPIHFSCVLFPALWYVGHGKRMHEGAQLQKYLLVSTRTDFI